MTGLAVVNCAGAVAETDLHQSDTGPSFLCGGIGMAGLVFAIAGRTFSAHLSSACSRVSLLLDAFFFVWMCLLVVAALGS